ncbi:MAG: class I SAM-dependent RNA methyltransferase [Nitrospiraceae bacterium]|nr:class I SAM-dependent RNA methyltransferase [Nitrospiraceae bacterium]
MITVKTEIPVYGGYTIARGDEGIVFVRGALPGETVRAVVSEKKKDYSVAAVSQVLEPSDMRVEPFCGHFGDCGGCHLQHASYEGQVAMKNAIIEDCFKRIAGIEAGPDAPLTGPDTRYRHRAQFKVSADGRIGFFRMGTRDVVPVSECPLLAGPVNEALEKIRRIPEEGREPIGGAGEIHITCGYQHVPEAGGCQCGPEAGERGGGGDEGGLFGQGLQAAPGLSALIKGRGFDEALGSAYAEAGFDTVFFGDGSYRGRGFVTLDLAAFKYSVSPLSFFQSNWRLNLHAVDAVKEFLGPLSDGVLLDIYSGGGNFSIPFAPSAGKIICVEENASSVKDAIRNLEINRIKNMKVIKSPFEKASLASKNKSIDAVIVDPPRPGLSREAAKKLLELQPEKLLYISCNPATLARDVKKLLEKYKVRSVRLVDFFPHTYHMEVLCLLARI